MNAWPWRSPEATRRALADRIADRYAPDERPRRLREIAYRRLLRRLFEAQPDDWLIKGGAALLLRLDPNRTSNDVDLTYVHEAGEYAVALRALGEAIALDVGDFFHFDVAPGHMVDADHPLERALSVPVIARIGFREFARFSVDLALPRADVDAERIDPQIPLTGVPAVDHLPPIATMTLPAQVADKVCAIYEKHGDNHSHSSRARDLADIAMIASQVDMAGDELHRQLRVEEQRRMKAGTLQTPLPDTFALAEDQQADWQQRWTTATRGAPIDFADAVALAALLLDPLLANRVVNLRWSAARAAWEAV